MNTLYKQILFVILLMISSSTLCGQRVYLSEASRKPFERTIFIDSKGDMFRYTAFYKGVTKPEEDIYVEFSVDATKGEIYNAKTGSGYKVLPKGSYTLNLKSAVIKKGFVSTQSGEVKIIATKGLKPFEKYLLPVTVKVIKGGVEVDTELSTIYYVIQAVPTSGNIPRKEIGKLPSEIKSAFGFGGKYLITVDNERKLTSYRYSGGNLSRSEPIEGSEYLKGLDNILNFRDHHIVGLNREINRGQLWSYPISADARRISPMDKVFGTAGYADFVEIFPFENNLYCLSPSGELKLYPLSDSMEWGPQPVRSLGSGWNYPILFGYRKSLIAIDENGNMWEYPLLTNGQPGLPKKIGTGWGIYEKIVVIGDDLLCIDKNGTVWQIKFSNNGYWTL